jgi:hypothetical protein
MAPHRKKTAPGPSREFKLRIPGDVSDRLIAKAKLTGWPQNRVIINELADYPRLERRSTEMDLAVEMENTLARYGSRIVMLELSEKLLAAVDEFLMSGPSTPEADKLRIARNAMIRFEAAQKKSKRE